MINPSGEQVSPNTKSDQLTDVGFGGHEVFDVQEVIAGLISLLDQYQMYEQYIQDTELKRILQHQTAFLTHMYNSIIDCFKKNRKTISPIEKYEMTLNVNVTFGIKPSQPLKPNQSVSELSERGLSAYMLGHTKSLASLFAMTSLEMPNPMMRRIIANNVSNLIEMSYEIFLYQNKYGYYQVPQLKEQDLNYILNSYTAVLNPSNNFH
nr:spore coat protein [Bacillus solimangrovi]